MLCLFYANLRMGETKFVEAITGILCHLHPVSPNLLHRNELNDPWHTEAFKKKNKNNNIMNFKK